MPRSSAVACTQPAPAVGHGAPGLVHMQPRLRDMNVAQGADSRKTLIAFNATEAGANNQLNFLEFDEAFNLLDR